MLVRGDGGGTLVCEMINLADAATYHLHAGDWVMLDDPDWPVHLQNYRIGRIVSIGKRKDGPLFAEIRIRPYSDLKKLREVMVLTKN